MKKVKIFLASSVLHIEERYAIESFIRRKNDSLIDMGIYLHIQLWENFSKNFSSERKQNEYNAIIKDSDIFICLIRDKVGNFTKEEFLEAYDNHKVTGKPKYIFVYFSEEMFSLGNITKDFLTVIELKETIQNIGQIWGKYSNIPDLIININNELTKIIDEKINEQIANSEEPFKIILNHVCVDFSDRKRVVYSKYGILEALNPFRHTNIEVTTDEGYFDESMVYMDSHYEYKKKTPKHLILKTDFGRTINRGEIVTRNFSCVYVNSFIDNESFFQETALYETDLQKLTILFPTDPKYTSYYMEKIIDHMKPIRMDNIREIQYLNKPALDFEIRNPELFVQYRISWNW